RQPGTEGSGKGTGRILKVPDESTVIYATSSEGTATKSGVPDEKKVQLKKRLFFSEDLNKRVNTRKKT
nr:hypothetical protein [Tanacetum cinerariifolium]